MSNKIGNELGFCFKVKIFQGLPEEFLRDNAGLPAILCLDFSSSLANTKTCENDSVESDLGSNGVFLLN